jgi:hypothetical protein
MKCILVDHEGTPLQGYSPNFLTVDVTEEDTFTETSHMRGKINVAITGTFDATVRVEGTINDGADYFLIKEYTEPVFEVIELIPAGIQVRIGVQTGDFTSGEIACGLLQ